MAAHNTAYEKEYVNKAEKQHHPIAYGIYHPCRPVHPDVIRQYGIHKDSVVADQVVKKSRRGVYWL